MYVHFGASHAPCERKKTNRWCVDAVLRLLGVFHDVLYGDVAPVRPVSTLGVVSVRLSRSLFVPGRHLKKGGSPPFPPPPPPRSWLPHQGGHQEAGWFPLPSFPHQGGHCESGERRPHANVFFFFFFFFVNMSDFVYLYQTKLTFMRGFVQGNT